MGIEFELSRIDVENLFGELLAGTLGAELEVRLRDPVELPPACRRHVQFAEAAGRAWAAWSTSSGVMAAWGDYDVQASRQLNAYVLFVEWWDESGGHHAMGCYCDPKRPREWTIGRRRHCERR